MLIEFLCHHEVYDIVMGYNSDVSVFRSVLVSDHLLDLVCSPSHLLRKFIQHCFSHEIKNLMAFLLVWFSLMLSQEFKISLLIYLRIIFDKPKISLRKCRTKVVIGKFSNFWLSLICDVTWRSESFGKKWLDDKRDAFMVLKDNTACS